MPQEGSTGPDVVVKDYLASPLTGILSLHFPLFGQREERKVNKIPRMFSLKLNEFPVLKICPVLWCLVFLTVFSLEITFLFIELF